VCSGTGYYQSKGSLVAEQFATVDQYIGSFPEDVQVILEEVRRRIRGVAPEAGETISYQIPTMTLSGRHLVYFAAWKHHISVYPVPALDESLEQELAPYRAGRGTVRFPLNKPIPYGLIERLVALLVQRSLSRGQPQVHDRGTFTSYAATNVP
jgi:uncharacterized protein YdhG (YjbR/CyaY superfamily)